MADENGRSESGFELDGEFYTWHVSDIGKDLMLIDRFCGLPISEFFEKIDDDFERGRAPILLSLIATSIRKSHPEWTVERIVRLVLDHNLGEVVFVDVDEEAPEVPPSTEESSTGGSSSSQSKSPPSETAPELSATSNATPA